ncbi:MAG TPA: YxeA family protein [Candidatus Faecimonas gallistercoris]|nr:YxeA family protein [Candidatus Faecimonas gallistercoris]
MKGKIFAGIGIVVVIAVFFVIFWLLFYQESTYYTKIDNTKVEQLDSGDMRYEYTLDAYNEKGNSKEVTFKTSRELKDDAYLKLDVMLTRGVKSWEEVQFSELPDKVQEKYE